MDESGTPPKPNKAQGRYLVIGGVIIPEGAWHGIAREFRAALTKYKITGEIKWKYFGTGNNSKGNTLTHLFPGERDGLRTEVFRILTARKAVKVVCCVTSIEAAYARPSIVDQNDVYNLTYKAVTERFQYFLQDATRIIGQPQYGLVVADHRMSDDDKSLRERHHSLIYTPEPFTSTYKNFVETIFFSPSEVSVGLQLADMVAGAVHRRFQYGEARFYEQIESAFRTSAVGQIEGFGLVKMPKGTFVEPSGGGTQA